MSTGSSVVSLNEIEALFEIQQGPSSPGGSIAAAAPAGGVPPTAPPATTFLGQFPDTLRFLSLVGSLEDHSASEHHHPSAPTTTATATDPVGSALVLPELRAAAGLFLRDQPLIISRAPGRLDVMGGIADYSGSTVLQMPIAEAAHVALQLQTARHQRLWRHMHPRQPRVETQSSDSDAKESMIGPPHAMPAVRVVSLNADATNRGPAFDMDISELYDGNGEPISYAAAREFFHRDPALSWSAYVVGGLLVLMKEKGVRPQEGIAMLVSSEVPEGKGVSSSAAVEVASMSALAAA